MKPAMSGNSTYIINGGGEGASRLHLLSRVMKPAQACTC